MVMGRRMKDLGNLGIVFITIILLYYVSTFFFARFDLTSEKRYTLTPTTIELLNEVDDVVFIRVYLDGDLPAGFRRLRDRTREMLDEFRVHSNDNVEYQFISPITDNAKADNDLQTQLVKLGIEPTNIQIREDDGMTTKLVFPGAIMSYRGEQIPLQLLKSQMGKGPEEMLNGSMEDLEYELSNGIRKLTKPITDQLAFITGHNELEPKQVADMQTALSEYYNFERLSIEGKLDALVSRTETDSGTLVFPKYKAVIIAKPDTAFTEKDKFILDQYIMFGGRVLWLIEPVMCNMDSLQYQPTTYALPISVNLEDMLFKYGVRVNTDVIQDARCSQIPGPAGYVGNQLQWSLQPWIYFPIMIPGSNHPIVKNVNGIKMEFASSIDTVSAPGIAKTVLLQTSKAARILRTPARVSLDIMKDPPKPEQFNKPFMNTAVLLEGKFTSVFKNRIPPKIRDDQAIRFRELGMKSKMIVISDGDIMRNHISNDGRYMALGFDRYTKQMFGNKKFLLNCINYLCDDSGLISNRSRALEIRLLDSKKIAQERQFWQLVNVAMPILLILFFGLIISFIRKKKYTT
ncbi:MAG: ABC-2 type transport system permease protein [Oceanospirillaceae bacterium]|jgi:ABC-2 type transport system permease protein